MSTAVLVTLPPGLSSDGLQVAVTFEGDEVQDVLVRPATGGLAWENLTALGGSVVVRTA